MPTVAIALIVLMTSILGVSGIRFARTTSNFYVASRSVHPVWNAFAVCGESLSAASFLGAPALVMIYGVDMLWALYGWGVGFLLLSLFVAAPVRRFGSYTIPEFVEGRLDSPKLRPIVAIAIIIVSFFYLLAQLKGAGEVVRYLTGLPYWVGVVAVGLTVAINLSAGGMRGITFVQGFQFFFIFLGILVPFVVVSYLWTTQPSPPLLTDQNPTFLSSSPTDYPETVVIDVEKTTAATVDGTIDEQTQSGDFIFEPGEYKVAAETTIVWPEGSLVPHSKTIERQTGAGWAEPWSTDNDGDRSGVYVSLSTFISNMLGILGLPHIIIRFYTNPTGRSARRTNLWVIALIMPYYAMLPLLGAAGRALSPGLLSSGTTDTVTIVIGSTISDGRSGELLGSIVAAGAAAAFLSTASGLLITMAGAVSHDVLSAGIPQFRRAVWASALVTISAGLLVQPINITDLIGWSTSFAASSICPILILGIWWTGLTPRGAYAALLVGGSLTTLAVAVSLSGVLTSSWPAAIVNVPAIWSSPAAFIAAIVVSRRDNDRVSSIGYKFALMHVPERREPQPLRDLV